MDGGQKHGLNRFLRITNLLEDGLLIVLLAIMIGFAVTQIILRNLFETGIDWADPLLHILVLWVGLAGAMVATRFDKHISVNVLTRYLPARVEPVAHGLVDLFASLVCAVVAYHATRFVLLEHEVGTLAAGLVPAWIAELIIPVAFGIIALRYMAFAVIHAREYLEGGNPP
jgi:TRAP-type C4-dicarboxylate transport system permease small subunit